jgi:hypothetical protein
MDEPIKQVLKTVAVLSAPFVIYGISEAIFASLNKRAQKKLIKEQKQIIEAHAKKLFDTYLQARVDREFKEIIEQEF